MSYAALATIPFSCHYSFVELGYAAVATIPFLATILLGYVAIRDLLSYGLQRDRRYYLRRSLRLFLTGGWDADSNFCVKDLQK